MVAQRISLIQEQFIFLKLINNFIFFLQKVLNRDGITTSEI